MQYKKTTEIKLHPSKIVTTIYKLVGSVEDGAFNVKFNFKECYPKVISFLIISLLNRENVKEFVKISVCDKCNKMKQEWNVLSRRSFFKPY